MAKAGLIEEMMNDALDSALDGENIEEETEEEIEKVLLEVAGETLAALPAAKARPVSEAASPPGGGRLFLALRDYARSISSLQRMWAKCPSVTDSITHVQNRVVKD